MTDGNSEPNSTFRSIIHLDLDSFYAQVECVRLGLDPQTTPLVVSQWGGILAVSYPARVFGISRHDSVTDALKKCPQLKVQHVPTISSLPQDEGQPPQYHANPSIQTHKASLHTYREASQKIMAIIKSHNFTSFQKASVDEAFIDCSDQVNHLMASSSLPIYSASSSSSNTTTSSCSMVDWSLLPENSTHLISHPQDIKTGGGKRDWQLFFAAQISLQIRNEIFSKLGYTSSTGIAHNKTLAKLVSATNKPNKQTALLDADVMEYMKTVPLVKIKGLGGKLGDLVVENFKCEMASDLWRVSHFDLTRTLGPQDGKWVYDIIRGQCTDAVKPSALTLSMQSCKNFRGGIKDIPTFQSWLKNLSTELFHRLHQDLEDTERWPHTVSVSLRCKSVSHTKQSPFPHRDCIVTPEHLYAIIEVIVLEFRMVLPCFYIQLALTGLRKVDLKSKSINAYFKVKSPSVKEVVEMVKVEEVRPPIVSPTAAVVRKEGVDIREMLDVVDEDGVPVFWKCGECGDLFEREKRGEHIDFHYAAAISRGMGGKNLTGVFSKLKSVPAKKVAKKVAVKKRDVKKKK